MANVTAPIMQHMIEQCIQKRGIILVNGQSLRFETYSHYSMTLSMINSGKYYLGLNFNQDSHKHIGITIDPTTKPWQFILFSNDIGALTNEDRYSFGQWLDRRAGIMISQGFTLPRLTYNSLGGEVDKPYHPAKAAILRFLNSWHLW